MALPPPLGGERLDLPGPAGRVAGYLAGPSQAADGRPPLLLVHSVNAAANAMEVRPVFEHAGRTRAVLAIDLPGYGLSDRRDPEHGIRRMTDAVLQATRSLQSRFGPGPIDALGVSLGCEFVARAAVEQPQAFRRLALVSPTGLAGGRERRGPPGAAVGPAGVLRALRGRPWSGPIFRALTRPAVIRYFLKRTWGGPDIDEALWRYDVLTTRQPDAEHAPLHFIAARLFAADITDVYEALVQPVWLSHGTRGDFTDYRGKGPLLARPNWRCTIYEGCGALMHFERPADFARDLDAFLDAPAP